MDDYVDDSIGLEDFNFIKNSKDNCEEECNL